MGLNATLRSNGHHNSRPNAGKLLTHRKNTESEKRFQRMETHWKSMVGSWKIHFPCGDDLFPFGHFSILEIWMSGSALTKTQPLKTYEGVGNYHLVGKETAPNENAIGILFTAPRWWTCEFHHPELHGVPWLNSPNKKHTQTPKAAMICRKTPLWVKEIIWKFRPPGR